MMIYTANEETKTLWLGQVDGVDDEQNMISVHRYGVTKKKFVPLYEDPTDNTNVPCSRPRKSYKPVIDYVVVGEIKAKNFALSDGAVPRDVLRATDFI